MNQQLKRKLYLDEVNEYNNYVHKRRVCIVSCFIYLSENILKSERRWYVRPLLYERSNLGHYNTMLKEHQLSNSFLFFNFTRMSSSTFEELLIIVGPSVQRSPSRPDILCVGEIVAATLRYLATGESMVDIMFNFRIGKSTISKLIFNCCNIIWNKLKDEVLFKPSTDGWLKISNEFESKWQMPHCVGALDGKHVVHQAFAKSGSTNFNYKGSHSTILMALCDANCNFTCVNIGMPGRCSDGGVFKASEMGKKILNNELNFPKSSAISENYKNIPYYIVADEAFPLQTSIMRPYPGRGKSKLPIKEAIFNYRLSRARRCIENTFGILVSRWRIYKRVIIASEQTIDSIIKATVVLHNFVKNKETESGLHSYHVHSNENQLQGNNSLDSCLVPVGRMGSNFYDRDAKEVRSQLTDYFSTEGSVAFQYMNI